MGRAVIRVTWKNDVAAVVDGQNYSASVNINETRRILTSGPFRLVGTSFYETPFDQPEPDVPALSRTLEAMLQHFRNPLPNGNPRAQVQTVSLTLWNIIPGTGPDEAEGSPQEELPQDLPGVTD